MDAINFALQMSEKCLKDEKLEDATSAALLWHLLILLCRQNGVSSITHYPHLITLMYFKTILFNSVCVPLLHR